MKYFILAEDLAAAVVGPFANSFEAEAHMAFCRQRGDSATMEVASEALADKWAIKHAALQMTAIEDRNWKHGQYDLAAGDMFGKLYFELTNHQKGIIKQAIRNGAIPSELPADKIDYKAAQAEIDELSMNAKHYLADSLGNPLHAAGLSLELGRYADVDAGLTKLRQRIDDMRLFTDRKP